MKKLLLFFCFSAYALCAQSQSLTGTWSWSGPNQSGGHLRTLQTKHVVRFQLEVQRGAPSYNSGFIEGEFDVRNQAGVFRSPEFGACEISFRFQQSKVVLTAAQGKADCGFGHNVYPDGTYRLRSRKKPAFSAGDPRFEAR